MSIIDMTREPPNPQQLCTVRYTPERTIRIRLQRAARHRPYAEMRIKLTCAPNVAHLLFHPVEGQLKAPPEGLAQFLHGDELVVDSLCNDSTRESPVKIELLIAGEQWLLNKSFEYMLLWPDHFCKRDLEVTVNLIIYRARHHIKSIGTRHNKKLHRSCAREVYELVNPARKGEAPPLYNPRGMPTFDTSGLPQPTFKPQVNNQLLMKALEEHVDLELVPLVDMTEQEKLRLWRENQRTKMWLERVASHIRERMMQIEVSLHGESPEFDELQRIKTQRQILLVGSAGRLEEMQHPQPVALLPLNLSKDTLQMLAVIVQDCPWFGDQITVEDTGYRGRHNIIVRPKKPFHTLPFPEHMIQVARCTKFIPAIPRYESPVE